MNRQNKKKIFILKAQLTSAIFLLVIALISGFFIFGPELTEIAKALTGNYSKATGEQLTVSDWNNLDDDFLDKQNPAGDSMAGPLTLPGDPTTNMQAATKQYVDGKITDTSGHNLRMVCGESSPANWEQYVEYGIPQPDELTTYIDTSSAGFTNVVAYISALKGTAGIWRTTGGDAIYEQSATGFRVYVDDYNPTEMTPAQALTWGWRVQWCGVGY